MSSGYSGQAFFSTAQGANVSISAPSYQHPQPSKYHLPSPPFTVILSKAKDPRLFVFLFPEPQSQPRLQTWDATQAFGKNCMPEA
jgi:hypothetical protein